MTLAVALHELPQELNDFSLLLRAGFSPREALIANGLVSLSAVIGHTVGFASGTSSIAAIHYVLPPAAGCLLYLALGTLVPMLQAQALGKTPAQLVVRDGFVAIGVCAVWGLASV